ncbi:Response regulator [Pseudomonas syringae pv. maculicola]|uniref:Response regulator n=1 Tax=Pseudomonas syringae pv. maculicola TaxID=59511 RepID=A0A3M3AI54_PSEYM|nr:Response regulator [Pseudomonas syringae pv. maculicola]
MNQVDVCIDAHTDVIPLFLVVSIISTHVQSFDLVADVSVLITLGDLRCKERKVRAGACLKHPSDGSTVCALKGTSETRKAHPVVRVLLRRG